jgi:hypothetical protein
MPVRLPTLSSIVALSIALVACGSTTPGSSDGGSLPAAATCSGAGIQVTEARSVTSLGENVDTTCASVVGFMTWKMGAAGSACVTPSDCTPVCCPCPNGTHHSLTAWCDHGLCATPDEVACVVKGTALGAYCDQ